METKEFDYKQDIRQTRLNSLGSSDAKMLQQIAVLGSVPRSAYKRLAVCKGLIEQTEIPYTDAVRFGDEIEQAIFGYLSETCNGYVSNPLWVSNKYSRKNCKCITHPDIVRFDYENKVLYVYEVKASRYTTTQVRSEYEYQLLHHWLLANEKVKELDGNWKVKLFLVHYQTDGLDLSQSQEFDVERLTIKQLRFGNTKTYELAKAMDIVDAFLEDFNEFYEGDEIDSTYLPEKVKQEFDTITNVLAEIKERETKVEEFKVRLFDFMKAHDVKSIKNESWSITRVDPTESCQFDSKAFLQDYATKHPRAYKKLVSGFEKVVKRKGSVQIRLKTKKDE
jgi:hypothetical protein